MAKKKSKKVIPYTFDDVQNFEDNIYGMSRNMVRSILGSPAIRSWSALQNRIFVCLISKIKWKTSGNSNVIEVRIDDFVRELGWDINNVDSRKVAYVIRDELSYMFDHCDVSAQDPYSGKYYEGPLILEHEGDSQYIQVAVNKRLMPHFEKLYNVARTTGVPFIPFFKPEVLNFRCKYSKALLEEFKSCCKTGGAINEHCLTTKQLKELFGLERGNYMREYDPVTDTYSKFDRANFEKNVLFPAIKELNQTCMIEILPYEDTYFEKEKFHGKVTGYIFKYRVYDLEEMKKVAALKLNSIIATND